MVPRYLPGRRHLTRCGRSGSFIIEAVVCVLILATASYGLVRLARHSADLSLHADSQLAATLTGQNVLNRLRGADVEQLRESSRELLAELSEESGREVSIDVIPFELQDRDGYHLRVGVTVEPAVSVVMHDWRIADENGGETSASRPRSAADELAEDNVVALPEGANAEGSVSNEVASNFVSGPESVDREASDGQR